MIAEIIGPSGRIHYRRSPNDPLVEEAKRTPGYWVRVVEQETVEPPRYRCECNDPCGLIGNNCIRCGGVI